MFSRDEFKVKVDTTTHVFENSKLRARRQFKYCHTADVAGLMKQHQVCLKHLLEPDDLLNDSHHNSSFSIPCETLTDTPGGGSKRKWQSAELVPWPNLFWLVDPRDQVAWIRP